MTAMDTPVDLGLLIPDQAPIPLAGRLTWDSAEPTDIHLTIRRGPHLEARWLIGRDLLTAGLDGTVGDSDVRIQPYTTATGPMLRIDLSSDTGAASLITARQPVGDFLRATWEFLPANLEAEVIAAALDAVDWTALRVADDAGDIA
jgi:Streptomyces sporulation and cell division protein, SsgA